MCFFCKSLDDFSIDHMEENVKKLKDEEMKSFASVSKAMIDHLEKLKEDGKNVPNIEKEIALWKEHQYIISRFV